MVVVTPWLVSFDKILAAGTEIFPGVTCNLKAAALSFSTGKAGAYQASSPVQPMWNAKKWNVEMLENKWDFMTSSIISSHFSPAR